MNFPDDCAHVIPGYSAAATIRLAFSIPKQATVAPSWPFNEGTHSKSDQLKDWLDTRAVSFLDAYEIDEEELEEWPPLTNVESLQNTDTIVLWLDNCLNSQLLACFVAWLHTTDQLAAKNLHELQFVERHGIFSSLGSFPEQELRARLPKLEAVSSNVIRARARFWKSYVSAQNALEFAKLIICPEISEIADTAIRSLTNRFPSFQTGLAPWEAKMLEYSWTHQPRTVRIVGEMLGNYSFEQADQMGDMFIYQRILDMGDESLAHPIFTFVGETGRMRDHTTHCRAIVQSILDGKANYLRLNNDFPRVGNIKMSAKNCFFIDDFDKV